MVCTCHLIYWKPYQQYFWMGSSALVGEVIFYVIGIPYMTFVLLSIKMQELSLQQILGFGLYPFILPDLGKLVIAVFLADRIKVLTKKTH